MTKDEVLKLALEALEKSIAITMANIDFRNKAITAIKQACALDKKAENARELGLDYEPHKGLSEHLAQATNGRVYVDPVTGDVGIGTPAAPVQPVALIDRLTNPEQHYEFTDPKKANAVLMSLCQEAADALAAQHEPENEPYVSLASVQEPVQATMKLESSGPGHGPAPNQKLSVRHVSLIDAGKTPPAQPAVPDALTSADIQEHIEYVAGWNDCRQAMLEMMK